MTPYFLRMQTGRAVATAVTLVTLALVSMPQLYGAENQRPVPATGPSAADHLSPERVPAWAQTGRFRYARWDGGIIEVVKGLLSGWPHWREPDQALAVARWYDPRNVELVERAELNWIWVTFSNGFSLESERPHHEQLRAFIAACHRRGIHVTAYMSIANIFPDDMFRREPRSTNWLALNAEGKPIPYGAADYSGFTKVTRYLACLRHPEWREYLKRRVERVIAAGGEGVMWDNALMVRCHCARCEADYARWRERAGAPEEWAAWTASHREMLAELVAELHAHAQRLKPDFLMYVNCNRGLYMLNRAGNAVTTEDGTEPGVTADGKVVSNIGSLRYQWAVGEGWRPVRMEYGGRLHKGPFESRFTIPMTPRSHQLAIAEAAAHHVGFEIFSLGEFQRDLYLHDRVALDNLAAAGRYNAFLKRHEEFYVKPRSLARLALLANDDDRQVQASRDLADRNAIFDVVFASTLTPEHLGQYRTVIAPDVRYLSDAQLEILARHVERGARLVVSGQTGAWNEHFHRRERGPLAGWFGLKEDQLPEAGRSTARGAGSFVYVGEGADTKGLTASLPEWDADPLVQVEAERTVRFNVHSQKRRARWLLHLLNYAPTPTRDVKVSLATPAAKVTLLSPDRVPAGRLKVQVEQGRTELTVPELDIYALVVIEPR